MHLICSLRGHKADAARARWNTGICFGRCVRCGSDLVRSVDGRWRVPHGYKVVWRATPAEELKPASPALMDWLEEQVSEPVAAPVEQHEPIEVAHEAIAQEPIEPAAAELIAAQAPLEWPLATRPSSQAEHVLVEPAPSPDPAVEEEPEPAAEFAGPDFMDESDDPDWDDFPAAPRRSAIG